MKTSYLNCIIKAFLWAVVFAVTLVFVAEWYLARQGFAVENAEGCREYSSYDPYLGWVMCPGRNLTAEGGMTEKVYETVWPDTSRASRAHRQKKASKRVLVLGCSHTYGMGVPDDATFVAKLNKRFPDICFDNFGVFAYGTYQCYLREKEQLLRHPDYDLVLYCAVIDHLNRNTAWGVHLGNIEKLRYYCLDPRVDLDEQGELRFYEPLRRWPGDDLLVSVNFAKRIYYCRLIAHSQLTRSEITSEKAAIFWELNQLMAKHAESYGARYGMVWLDSDDNWDNLVRLTRLAQSTNPWGNPKYDDPEYPSVYNFHTSIVRKDRPSLHLHNDSTAHYNAQTHTKWAKAIGDWVVMFLGKNKK